MSWQVMCSSCKCSVFSGDVNVGGIVAAVIIVALTIAVIGLALWYAKRKGYLPSKY